MDPTKLLEADHRSVEDLFDRIETAEGPDRMPLIDELATSLRGHMELEETTLYPAMEPVTGEETVTEGIKEHELARKALQDVLDLAPDQPGFGGALEALKAGIEHHVEEEENEVFPELRSKAADLLAEVATPIMQKRMELGMPIDPAGLAASSTKEELTSEAKAAGLDVKSSMTKDQIAESIADHLAGASS